MSNNKNFLLKMVILDIIQTNSDNGNDNMNVTKNNYA